MDALRIVLLIGIVAAGIAFTVEIRAWMMGTRLVTVRQKIYRVIAAVMIEIIFVLVFFWNDIAHSGRPLVALCYGSLIMALGFGLLFVALLDLRETLAVYRERRIEAYRNLTGEETEQK